MSDKSNRTICMEKAVYKEKINVLLNDTSTYIQLKENPLKKLQTKTSNILRDLNNNDFLETKYNVRALTLTDTMLAKGYGLVKLHKENHPVRPIIFLVNSRRFKESIP